MTVSNKDKIFKYPLATTDRQVIEMPSSLQFLDLQVQNGIPCVWAKVDSESDLIKYEILTFGTGITLPKKWMFYLGTYQLSGGEFVFHVFYRELEG